jgi:antitoxin FitA
MATLRILNVDEAIKEKLRLRAAGHGRSVEAEALDILTEALKDAAPPAEPHLYERIRARFAPLGGADDIELPPPEFLGTPDLFDA